MRQNRPLNKVEYFKLRRRIIKRDGGHCQWPNCKENQKLQIHHIKKYSDYPVLRMAENNLITLCKRHHKFIWGKEEYYESVFISIVFQNIRKIQNG